jgi:hypothetical protein
MSTIAPGSFVTVAGLSGPHKVKSFGVIDHGHIQLVLEKDGTRICVSRPLSGMHVLTLEELEKQDIINENNYMDDM